MLITTTSHVFANITAPQQVKFTTNVRRIVSGSFVNTTAVAGGWSLYQQALTSPAWIATHATVWDTATPGVPMTYAVSAQMSAPAFPGSANEAAYSCYISVTDFQ